MSCELALLVFVTALAVVALSIGRCNRVVQCSAVFVCANSAASGLPPPLNRLLSVSLSLSVQQQQQGSLSLSLSSVSPLPSMLHAASVAPSPSRLMWP